MNTHKPCTPPCRVIATTPAHIDGLQNSDYSLTPAYDFFSFLYDMETNPLGKAAADKMQAALDNTVTFIRGWLE